jgi:enamine deaminase RidA (YjgF/YER057c/UK114 family)
MIQSGLTTRGAIILILGVAVAVHASAQKGKKKTAEDPVTQTLPVLKDPPGAISAETARLVFHVSPLSNKGLLSQQIRDALKALLRDTHGAAIVKLRAFVAGSGDMRRVSTIVSETFTEHKLALPVVSTIEVGALPLEGAQVVIESIAVEKRNVNKDGLAFYSAQPVKQLRQLPGALRATCFLSSLEDLAKVKSITISAFSGAVVNFVQSQRLGFEALDVCEAVARLDRPPAQPWSMENGAALVNAPKIVLTGTQMAFRDTDADLRLAFERLGKALEPLGVTYRDVFWSSAYPLTRPVEEKVRAMQQEFFDRSKPPAGTMLLFEGLPSLDATMAMDVIAAAK